VTSDKAKDERTRVVSVRLTDDEIAVLPPAETDSGRVRTALTIARELGPAMEGVAALAALAAALRDDNARLSARLDAQFAALDTRIRTIAEGPDAFHRLALEADARDIETSVCDVWAVCMEIWQQTLNNHLNITLIREALVDGDADPASLMAERRARLARLETEGFRDCRDRATWMLGVTETWRQMRLRERDAHQVGVDGGAAVAAPAAAE
jgi:hypothetical protein